MHKKDENGLKPHKTVTKKLTREYLHSISRIGDRLKVLKRDIENLREDVGRDLTDMEEDVQMLSSAFDSLFSDFISRVHNKKTKHEVEEI